MSPVTFATLDRITHADLPRAGGKAFNCARLRQAGFPVPDALLVSAMAADEDVAGVAGQPWFDGLPEGTTFAVRSSGIAEDSAGQSFAGIHETRLHVPRARVAEAVAGCRQSAASDQALAYRRAQHLPVDSVRIGVLVQRMVPALTSGVAFTVHPVSGADEVVINSAWGLGEALVSGQVDPDEFTVRKRDLALTSTRLGSKGGEATAVPSLSPGQIAELADMLVRIEQHYMAPQDVEWCHDGRQFWIVQSRPVTTRLTAGGPAGPAQHDDAIEWTRANLAEVFPDQISPQALSTYTDMLNRAERQYMGRLLAPESVLGPMFKAFHGRLYFNLTQLRHVCAIGGSPAADLLRSMGHSGQITPDDEIAKRPRLGDVLPCVPDLLRVGINNFRAGTIVSRHEERVRAVIERYAAIDAEASDDRALWAEVEAWQASAPDYAQVVLVLGSVMFHETALRKMCTRVGFSYERLAYTHLAAGQRSVSTKQAVDLVSLSDEARREPAASAYLAASPDDFQGFRHALAGTRFLERFDRFLDEYGHRGRYESDWALPRYREDPKPLLSAVRAHLQGPAVDDANAVARRQAQDAREAWSGFEARLSPWQRLTLLPRARSTLARLKRHYVWREQCRSDLTRVLAYLRAWHLSLAGRFVARGWLDRSDDYFMLHFEEVGSAIRDARRGHRLRAIAAGRRAEMDEAGPLRMPMLMREADLPRLLADARAPIPRDGGDVLTGLCVSPGCVEGPVVVMRDPGEFARMTRGAILVAPATDPSWTPLFTLAAGVVVEVGGMLSHASTIAREYGLPALANVRHATDVLADGEWVRLDATGGRVERVGKL